MSVSDCVMCACVHVFMCSCVCQHVDDTVFSTCSFFIFCHVHAVRTRCMPTDRSKGNLHK